MNFCGDLSGENIGLGEKYRGAGKIRCDFIVLYIPENKVYENYFKKTLKIVSK